MMFLQHFIGGVWPVMLSVCALATATGVAPEVAKCACHIDMTDTGTRG